jgi:hypothetical protein
MLLGVYGIGGSLASAKPTTGQHVVKHAQVHSSAVRSGPGVRRP